MKSFIKDYIKESISAKNNILENNKILELIEESANIIINTYKNNKKILIAGNGGSAADAQHIATEFVSKFTKERKALNAIALTTNTSIITAVSNDYDYSLIFSRQIEALAQEGDIFIAISTSGNSENIIKAIKTAKELNLVTIGLVGSKPSQMDNLCDYLIKVPSDKTSIIQESHIMIGHMICGLVENNL